jgi:hypothetical protein
MTLFDKVRSLSSAHTKRFLSAEFGIRRGSCQQNSAYWGRSRPISPPSSRLRESLSANSASTLSLILNLTLTLTFDLT